MIPDLTKSDEDRIQKFQEVLIGNRDAALFVAMVFRVFHAWDDLIDRDVQLADEEINMAFYLAMVQIPRNPFYRANFADLSPYPFVAGESQPNTWMTPTQAATRIATLGGYWREVIGPAIEAARINGKDALDSLTDPAAIDAHVAAVVANLDAI